MHPATAAGERISVAAAAALNQATVAIVEAFLTYSSRGGKHVKSTCNAWDTLKRKRQEENHE